MEKKSRVGHFLGYTYLKSEENKHHRHWDFFRDLYVLVADFLFLEVSFQEKISIYMSNFELNKVKQCQKM